jgi:basic membrane protein A
MRGIRTAVPLLLIAALAAWGCGQRKPQAQQGALHVGLVFDVGGRGDKSFNDSAYRGLERAKQEMGIDFEFFEPREGDDRESALRVFASGPCSAVFGIGFLFTDDITAIAGEFPQKKFACVDYTATAGREIPPNLVALKFREEEGSFLIGALAGLLTKTNAVGFVGGMDIPLIHKFELGFAAGVRHVNSEAKVLIAYAGVEGSAFRNPTKGKELALAQYGDGADIIYHASGSTGLGVFEAARQTKKLAVGVDSDQYGEAPGFILTSMVKDVDVAVFETIKAVRDGTFQGGVREFGLKEGGIHYVYDEHNKALIPDDVHAKVEEIRQQIIRGEIQVPSVKGS